MGKISGMHINAHEDAVILRSLAINKCIKNDLRGYLQHVIQMGWKKSKSTLFLYSSRIHTGKYRVYPD